MYDGHRFFANGTVAFDTKGFDLKANRQNLRKAPFEVFSKRKNWFDNAIDSLEDRKLRISTQVDTDVFFILLEHFYGITWK